MTNTFISVNDSTSTPRNVDAFQYGTDYRQVVATHACPTATGPTPARITAATSSTQLLASNTARLGVVIHNDSDATLYVKYGTAASTTSYVYKLPSQFHLILPEPSQPLYTGIIHGIWSSATGAATVNELT